MTRGIARRIASATTVIALAIVGGCNDSVGPRPDLVPVASVTVTPPTKSLLLGEHVTLQATPKAADGKEIQRVVTWASENESRATVSETGVVTTLAVGEVGITATSEGRVGRSVITVLPLPPVPVAEVRLSVDDEIVLEWNGSIQIHAVALDADGNVLPGRVVEWMSNRSNIVTVTDGLIQAIDDGLATVTAVIEGVPASVGVRVNMAPVTELFIDKESDGLEVGEVALLGSRVRRASGEEFYEPVTWTSSDASLVTIHPDLWSAGIEVLREGTVTITASKDGKSTSFTFRITPRASHDLIYNKWTGSASEIFLLDLAVDGNIPVRLNAGNVSRDPSPSPDGSEFVFAVSQQTPLGETQNDLFIVNRDGMNMRWLTRMPGLEDSPEWSPDGNWILFHGVVEGRHDLFLIHKTGGDLRNITAGMPEAMTVKYQPAWSPDGTRIAFVGVVGNQYKVWTIGADGTNPVQVTTDAGFDASPTWSPAGDRIAFVRYNTTNPAYGDDIMIGPSAGGTPTRLSLPGDQQVPAWSPDGHYIAVSGTVVAGQGIQQIFTLRPDGTALRRRTLDPVHAGGVNPAWIRRQ